MAQTQSIPFFDGDHIFNNWNGSCSVLVQAGTCAPIKQEQHFDRYDGSLVIHHGYPNRPWTAVGEMIFATRADANARLATLQSYEDDLYEPDTWRVLIDSNGNTWSKAKLETVTVIYSHAGGSVSGSTWIIGVVVTGFFDGSPLEPGA